MAKVLNGQSVFDIAIQQSGSASAAVELAVKNNISITGEISSGETLGDPAVNNEQIAGYFSEKGLTPATMPTITEASLGGIDNMTIEEDFIIG